MSRQFEQKIPRSSPNKFQYIVEKRGGYDEWSDEYNAVVAISFPDGSEFRTRFFDDEFETAEGHTLQVEFPSRPNDSISVEQYDPSYDHWEISSINKFTEKIEQGEIKRV